MEKYRAKGGFPVIAVEHVRYKVNNLHRLQNAFGKKDKPLSIIEIVTVRGTVEIVPVVIFVLFDEIGRYSVVLAFDDLGIDKGLRYLAGNLTIFILHGEPMFFYTLMFW